MKPKRILVVDDHPVFREGLRAVIERGKGFEVVAEAGTAREALRVAQECKPDILIVDLSLPDKPGIELIGEMQILLPGIPIMVVTVHTKIDFITAAFDAGARGYLVKESASDRLLEGLELIANGGHFLDVSLSGAVIKKLTDATGTGLETTDSGDGVLSRREREILRLLATGLTPKSIASKLFISPKTVENHRASIMKKLHLHSSVELIRYSERRGLIQSEFWEDESPPEPGSSKRVRPLGARGASRAGSRKF